MGDAPKGRRHVEGQGKEAAKWREKVSEDGGK
jgi:hypothetical protein